MKNWLVLASLCVAGIAHGDVTFADGDFSNGLWWSVGGPIDTHNSARAPIGGNPDAFWQMDMTWGPSAFLAAGGFTEASWVYDPTVSGAITSVDMSTDMRAGTEAARTPFLFLEQNSVLYGFDTGVFSHNTAWNSFGQNGLQATDFFALTDAGADFNFHPDFGGSAGALTVFWGEWFAGGSTGPHTDRLGFDNTVVTFHNGRVLTPEPVTMSLGIAGIGLFARRRRAKK